MRIAFLLTSNSISGGIFTVFKHASALRSRGHDVVIGFMLGENLQTVKHFPGMEDVRLAYWRDLIDEPPFDIAVATWWETAFLLPEIRASHYAYLVQGFEKRFYDQNQIEQKQYQRLEHMSESQGRIDYEHSDFPADLISHTLEEKVHFITVSSALSLYLKDKFNQESSLVPCGINLEAFEGAQAAIPKRGTFRVMVEGLPNEVRKKVQYSLEILSPHDDIEIVYVSPDGKPDYQCRIDYFFQSIPYDQMPSLYKSCDILLKLSSTESVALPVLEMFAAGGTAIVSSFEGHNEYIKHGRNALVVPLDDKDAIKQAVQELKEDSHLRARLQKEARQTAKRYSLENSTAKFEQALVDAIESCHGCGRLERLKKSMPVYRGWDGSLLTAGNRV